MSSEYISMILDEEDAYLRPVKHSPRSQAARLNYRALFYYLLSLYIMTIFSVGIIWFRWTDPKSLLKSQRMLPDFPTTLVTFAQDHRYIESLAGEANSPWNDLVPPGKGFIRVESPATWDLRGGYPLEGLESNAEKYSISMFHQLHCLASLQKGLSNQLALFPPQETDSETRVTAKEPHITSSHNIAPSSSSSHLGHCVDYLRQAIMCAGDTTLERAIERDGKLENGVDGWGVTHQCRDWQSIYNFAIENRARNASGIL